MTLTNTRILEEEVRAVLEIWRIKPLFTRPTSGTANASLVIVTPRGQYVLRRRNPHYASSEQLVYDHSVLRAMRRAGLPVPKVVRTPSGSRWAEYRGCIYELFEFIEGEAATPEHPEEIHEAATMLARWHLAGESLAPRGRKNWPRYFDPHISLEMLKQTRQRPEAATPEILEIIDFLILQAQRALADLPDEAYWTLPQTIIHGDWHPANFRFRQHRLVGIFDFDWTGRQPRMIDVTDGLLFFCSRRHKPIDGSDIWALTQPAEPQWELMKIFMTAYQEHIRLQPEEWAALPALMRQRWLYCRVDAMQRKIAPPDQLRFLTTGIREIFLWIDNNEEALKGPGWN